jgi:hypothetical protein
MSNVFKRVELLTNLAIIAVAVVLSVVLIKQFILTKQTDVVPAAAEVSPGEKIPLTEVDWSKNGRTLLLVLQKDCHFCTESAPFYQRLVKETSNRGDVRLVALLPQQIADGKQYLDQLGVSIADVRQVSPGQVKVHGTPTLILVNENGVVTDVWAGKLQSDAESQVLNKL